MSMTLTRDLVGLTTYPYFGAIIEYTDSDVEHTVQVESVFLLQEPLKTAVINYRMFVTSNPSIGQLFQEKFTYVSTETDITKFNAALMVEAEEYLKTLFGAS